MLLDATKIVDVTIGVKTVAVIEIYGIKRKIVQPLQKQPKTVMWLIVFHIAYLEVVGGVADFGSGGVGRCVGVCDFGGAGWAVIVTGVAVMDGADE